MRAPGRTLRARIVWSTAAVAAVAMAATIGTVVLVLDVTARNNVDAALRDRLDSASATLAISPSGSLKELRTPDDAIDDTTWIFDSNGQQIDAPRAGKRVQAKAESLARVTKRTTFESHDRVYLAAPIRDRTSGDVRAVIVVTESMTQYETTRIVVLAVLATLGLFVTAGSAALAAWTMRRALEPVEEMATLAEEWSEHDLEARFGETPNHDEISHLGRTLNVLLDRVAGAIRAEQQLTSELAHELRTPLTAIRGEAELALMSSGPDQRLDRVVDLADRMDLTIGALLAIAREETEIGRSDVAAMVGSVIADLPESHHLTMQVDLTPGALQVAVSPHLAARALSPVVVNATQHAKSSVTVTVKELARTVDITVADDGPGIGDRGPEDLFAAGGLGLPLSRRVARSLGGDVRVTSPSNPTSFTVTLPRF